MIAISEQTKAGSTKTVPPSESDQAEGAAGAQIPVVPARNWTRLILSLIAVFIVLQFAWSLVTTQGYEWNVFAQYFFSDSIIRGIWLTLFLTVVSATIGFILGGLLALARLSTAPLLSGLAWTYIWFFRSVPLVVQLLVWYNLGYLYPTLGLGTPFTDDYWLFSFKTVTLIPAVVAAILGLSLSEAAYSSEIIRGGILSVDQGQLEAAAALGLPRRVRFFRIVLPQAARSIVPNAFNQVIALVKGTSVVFVVAIPEIFYSVQVIYQRTQRVIPLLLVAVVWYTIITTILSIIQYYIERHYARGSVRELPPTPIQRVRDWIATTWASLGEDATASATPSDQPHTAPTRLPSTTNVQTIEAQAAGQHRDEHPQATQTTRAQAVDATHALTIPDKQAQASPRAHDDRNTRDRTE